MSIHALKDGDLVILGIRQPLPDATTFRKNAEKGIAKYTGVKVKILVVIDAPGLFEVLRCEE